MQQKSKKNEHIKKRKLVYFYILSVLIGIHFIDFLWKKKCEKLLFVPKVHIQPFISIYSIKLFPIEFILILYFALKYYPITKLFHLDSL